MNYLKVVKDAFNVENKRGMKGQVIVNERALRMLIEDYERMDAYFRARDESTHGDLEHSLYTYFPEKEV